MRPRRQQPEDYPGTGPEDRLPADRRQSKIQDVGHSPCGIPYVHGKEIPKFENLVLQDKAFYKKMGLDIHHETRVNSFDLDNAKVSVEGEGDVAYDKLVVATGFKYKDPGVPGTDLQGLYYVKNIHRAMA